MTEPSRFGHWGDASEEILRKHFPLHRACRDGDVENLSLLLLEAQHGIYVEDNFYGWTPAHWAAYFGKLGCLMRLLNAGLNCDATTIRLMQTPAQIAAFAGHSHCLKWLLHCGASIDKQDYLGETAIHKAARTGSMECVSLLASHNARLYVKNNSGQTPAQLASNCGYINCAEYLERAIKQQDSDARGVYEQSTRQQVPPQPFDITVGGTGKDSQQQQSLPFAQAQAPVTNGHCQDMEAMEDCDMEEDSRAPPAEPTPMLHMQNGHHHNPHLMMNGQGDAPANGSANDVTIDSGISENRVLVAGRKRTIEDVEESGPKRARTHDWVPADADGSTSIAKHLWPGPVDVTIHQSSGTIFQPCEPMQHSQLHEHAPCPLMPMIQQVHSCTDNPTECRNGPIATDEMNNVMMEPQAHNCQSHVLSQDISLDTEPLDIDSPYPYQDILAMSTEPLRATPPLLPSIQEEETDNQYWHFVV